MSSEARSITRRGRLGKAAWLSLRGLTGKWREWTTELVRENDQELVLLRWCPLAVQLPINDIWEFCGVQVHHIENR